MTQHLPMQIAVCGAFDDLRSHHLRLLEEASKLGDLTVLLWPDDAVQRITGSAPKFLLPERLYFLNAIRYVKTVRVADVMAHADVLPELPGFRPEVWVVDESQAAKLRVAQNRIQKPALHVVSGADLKNFPEPAPMPSTPGRKKVIVTGCYDWVHTGHVRFFEEVSAYGDLYVTVGNDANIRMLKGEGHPLLSQEERRYIVGSIRHVKQALIATGHGWVDADPDIRRIKPDIYAVNEDGDKGGKREYCQELGLEYLVLKRTPAPGLPRRSSTDLRGF